MSAEPSTPREPDVSERVEGERATELIAGVPTQARSETSGTPSGPERALDKPSSAPTGILKVLGKCPMGCGETLYRASDGRVFCVRHDCPNPLAATELLFGLPVRDASEAQLAMEGVT